MKLVTFNDGQVGYVDGEAVVELDVPSMRDFFEQEGKVEETGRRFPSGRSPCRRRSCRRSSSTPQATSPTTTMS